MTDNPKTMSADKAVRILTDIQNLGLTVYLDGGWGIDALLETETRTHTDVDFLIEKRDLPVLMNYFADNGYKQADDFNKWWHMSFESDDSIIDIHVIVFDQTGKAIYGPEVREGFAAPGSFPAYAFKGTGKINDFPVKCLSAEYRVKCQTRDLLDLMPDNYRYQPTHKDYLDVEKLCRKFDIEMPEELQRVAEHD